MLAARRSDIRSPLYVAYNRPNGATYGASNRSDIPLRQAARRLNLSFLLVVAATTVAISRYMVVAGATEHYTVLGDVWNWFNIVCDACMAILEGGFGLVLLACMVCRKALHRTQRAPGADCGRCRQLVRQHQCCQIVVVPKHKMHLFLQLQYHLI